VAQRIEPVIFPNRSGLQLFGMLHHPVVNRAPGTAVLLLSPGIKGRIAPHRLYIKLARKLCDEGFKVLRFDYYGLGDAEGDLEEKMVAEVYAAVAMGRYADDTLAAMDWMQREHQIERFVLSGLCGGAITGLFAGAKDSRVHALVGFGIPVIQYGDEGLRYKHLSSGEQHQFRRGYARKLLDWKSWLRLLTFRSDFSIIAKVFLSPLRNVWKKSVKSASPSNSEPPLAATLPTDNTNPFFPPAFFEYMQGTKKMYLLFGSMDRLYWDFTEKFYQPQKSRIDLFRSRFQIDVIDGARHIFEEINQHQALILKATDWISSEMRTIQT